DEHLTAHSFPTRRSSDLMLKGAGKVISQATGGTVGVNPIVVAMTVMFILYSFVGGLISAAWTDLFQGFLIIVLSFMLIPLGWSRSEEHSSELQSPYDLVC